MHHMVSYSSPHGMPPTMTEAAAIFKRENRQSPAVSGMQLLDSTEPPIPTKIIFAPEPTEPFRRLPFYLSIVWSASLLPFILLLCIRISRRIRQLNPLALASHSVFLAFLSTFVLLLYGRVSLAGSIALRLSIIAAVGTGFTYCVKAYLNKKFVVATILITMSVCLLLFIYPVFLHL